MSNIICMMEWIKKNRVKRVSKMMNANKVFFSQQAPIDDAKIAYYQSKNFWKEYTEQIIRPAMAEFRKQQEREKK